MKTVSLSSIIADYRDRKLQEEIATDWGSLVFYRMPAFLVAWAMVPLGVTPNQLTLLGALMVPAMALAAWFLPPGEAMWVVTILALAFNVLDCADGPLARALNRSSLSGRYMDFAADIMYRNVAYGCYGLIADRMWPGAAFPWLAVGLCCGLLATYARVNRLYAEKLFPAKPEVAQAPRRWSAFDVGFSFLSGLDTLLPIIAVLAWQAGMLRGALLWFLLFTAADAVVEVVGNYMKARRRDSGIGG
ncbi:MAG: CDP-alcohol phosphatidyltransferase family protein [Aestuariivirga sp.]|uniref:CDP-alcohol phosphatidyltransferase family protein n=1 Tax=Aestuariivirga sp. TaxID=2650926 RepID=UPI003017FE71